MHCFAFSPTTRKDKSLTQIEEGKAYSWLPPPHLKNTILLYCGKKILYFVNKLL